MNYYTINLSRSSILKSDTQIKNSPPRCMPTNLIFKIGIRISFYILQTLGGENIRK